MVHVSYRCVFSCSSVSLSLLICLQALNVSEDGSSDGHPISELHACGFNMLIFFPSRKKKGKLALSYSMLMESTV